MMAWPAHPDARVVTLAGGPHDGCTVAVEPCVHGDWPDVAVSGGHDDQPASYRYDEDTQQYRHVVAE